MTEKHQLVAADYVVIVMMLLISTVIGFKFKLDKNKPHSVNEYLMAGKNMVLLPVILSISVTLVSGISLIVTPAEVYRYDIQYAFSTIGVIIGIFLSANVFLPVYFKCGVSTIYEYLEMRFGKKIKYVVSSVFILQTTIVMSIVLFPPVLALNAVSGLSIEFSILLCGSVCTVYCLLGGLKGVLWTDTFQCLLMFTFLITIYITGIQDSGGVKNVYQKALKGDKLNVDFSMNIFKRYTFWNAFTMGLCHGFGSYGASQMEVQRALSLKNVKRAKTAMFGGATVLAALHLLVFGLGLIMYAVFFSCDPLYNKEESGISKFEQIIPYYLVNRFSSLPGMTGLCIAGIFSGSLSTISSALNSFATVVVLDYVQPLSISFNHPLTDFRLLFIAKSLTLMFGVMCTSLPFLMMQTTSVKQLASLLHGVLEGPMAAVFAAGVLSRKVTEKCALVGFFVGFGLNTWFAYGSLLSGYIEPPKNLGTNCTFYDSKSTLMLEASNFTCSTGNVCTESPIPNTQNELFALYKISFMWVRQIGFLTSVITMFIGVLITGWKKDDVPFDSKYLSPVTQLWSSRKSKNNKIQNFVVSSH